MMVRKITILFLVLITIFLFSYNSYAKRGCCSHHGGVCFDKCCDGTPLTNDCKPFYPTNIPKTTFKAITLKVIDGDTIDVLSLPNFTYYRVRLYGIDCPELTQPLGLTSKEFVVNLLLKNEQYYSINIKPIGFDKYKRLLGIIYLSDKKDDFKNTLEAILVGNGLAFVYPFCNKKIFCDFLKTVERKAKEDNIGIWKIKVMFPWEYRKLYK